MHKLQTIRNHRMIRFLTNVLTWSFVTICAVFMFVILLPHLPLKNQFSSYIITSGSMAPTIPAGSVVITTRQQYYLVEDIIAFQSPKEPGVVIVHRLVGKTAAGFETKGDNNNAKDAWTVLETAVHGSVFLHLPYVGYLATWVKKPLGYGILVGIPMFLLVFKCLLLIFDGIGDVKKKRIGGKKLLFFFLCLFGVSGTVAFDQMDSAKSLFRSQAVLSGISITVKNLNTTPSPTPKKDHDDEDDHDDHDEHDDRDDHGDHGHEDENRRHGKPLYVHGYHGNQVGHFRFVFSGEKRVRYLEYDVEYDSDQGRQGIHRHQDSFDEWDVTPPDIITGTCSTGGFCVSHTHVRNLHCSGTVTFEDGSHIPFDQDIEVE